MKLYISVPSAEQPTERFVVRAAFDILLFLVFTEQKLKCVNNPTKQWWCGEGNVTSEACTPPGQIYNQVRIINVSILR